MLLLDNLPPRTRGQQGQQGKPGKRVPPVSGHSAHPFSPTCPRRRSKARFSLWAACKQCLHWKRLPANSLRSRSHLFNRQPPNRLCQPLPRQNNQVNNRKARILQPLHRYKHVPVGAVAGRRKRRLQLLLSPQRSKRPERRGNSATRGRT